MPSGPLRPGTRTVDLNHTGPQFQTDRARPSTIAAVSNRLPVFEILQRTRLCLKVASDRQRRNVGLYQLWGIQAVSNKESGVTSGEIYFPYSDDERLWRHPEFPLAESLRAEPTMGPPCKPSASARVEGTS